MSIATLSATVSEIIGQLPRSDIRMPETLPALAKRLGVLPLTWDMGGCMALRPSGEVISWLWDEEDRATPVALRREQHAAMFQGATKFAELRPFLPARSLDAETCPSCRGTGVVSGIPEAFSEQVVCWCGGAGWVPAEQVGVQPGVQVAISRQRG